MVPVPDIGSIESRRTPQITNAAYLPLIHLHDRIKFYSAQKRIYLKTKSNINAMDVTTTNFDDLFRDICSPGNCNTCKILGIIFLGIVETELSAFAIEEVLTSLIKLFTALFLQGFYCSRPAKVTGKLFFSFCSFGLLLLFLMTGSFHLV